MSAASRADLDPGPRPALLALIDPQERGDPMSPLRWTAKSTRVRADELTARGHVSEGTVGDLLRAEGTPQHVLAGLFGVITGTIAKAERPIGPLLIQVGYVIEPAGTRIGTLAELTTYAPSHGIELTPKAKLAR